MKRLQGTSGTVIKYGSILVFSVIFMGIFALWTSPFHPEWYGCDASFFTMAGRGITKGWIPYQDFFDLKGPCFFFIQALGQLICPGRTGIWIIEVIAFFFTVVLIMKLSQLFISARKTLFIIALFSIFHAATLWGGNTLEEFMLPFNLLSIYLVIRDLYPDSSHARLYNIKSDNIYELNVESNNTEGVSKQASSNEMAYNSSLIISPLTSLVVGLCFGVMLFSKVTVAAPIIGLVIAVTIYLMQNKRFPDLVQFLLFSLLGILIITTVIILYFYFKGALSDMLYSVFVFAFKRGTKAYDTINLRWELKISGCYFALIYALCQILGVSQKCDENTENISKFLNILILCMAVVTAAVLHLGDPFLYYFTTVYPVLIVTFIAMFIKYDPFTLFKTWRLDVPILAFMITACYFASHTADSLNTVIYDWDNQYYKGYADAAREMASLIPANERDSVYSINMDMQWFEITNILPCYSYTINLQYFVELEPAIQDKIINRLETNPPKWIVAGGNLADYLPELDTVVVNKYEQIYVNDFGSLYILSGLTPCPP